MVTPLGSSRQFQTDGHTDSPTSLSELQKKTKGMIVGRGPVREWEG